jgi:hypothetical protein
MMAGKSVVEFYDTDKRERSKSLAGKSVVEFYDTDKRERSKSLAGKSVVEFYDTDKRQRSKSPAIAVSNQWDSRDSVPTSRETATINSAHTTPAKISHTHTALEVLSPLLFTSPINFMRCLPSSICYLQRANFDWPITEKEVKPRKLPKIEGFIYVFLRFSSPIYLKGVQPLRKHMG